MDKPANIPGHIKSILSVMPGKPGVYQYYDKNGYMIYVGKAKNLKKRVSSYFSGKNYGKTRVLVSKITEIKHIVVDSEEDALLLENNLIKKHQPRYNILLKDDKTFPWICIKNEPFPRVFSTRNPVRDGSDYFGPYTSAGMVKTLLELIRKLYPLRTCYYKLNQENIKKEKIKVCLEYHLGNCKGPCEGMQSEEDYGKLIKQVKNILKGNIQEVLEYLRKLMDEYATGLKYEEATLIKEKIKTLEKYRSRSTIVSLRIKDVDVFSIIDDKKRAYVNYLKVIKGALVQSHTVEIRKMLDEKREEILPIVIVDIRKRFSSKAKEIILPFKPDVELKKIKITVPQRGDKKKLLDLSKRNAWYYRREVQKRLEGSEKSIRLEKKLKQLQKDLRMKKLPTHIECFDNSNIQGTNPVAACVVFKNGKPLKREYRHYNIKTVKGANDFASMGEVVYRRYKRLLNEKKSLPQLVIVDGGKGQLNAAIDSLDKLNIRKKLTIIGIAKRLEEIFFPSDPVPLYLDKNSYSLKIIQNLRNEAHRFGILFHRLKRSGTFLESETDRIKGIGPETIKKLLKEFKSLDRIKKTCAEELEKHIGKAKTNIILKYFKNHPGSEKNERK
ncbi:MAG: excinuclease ABC subunit C [Bacteroidetes bacterium]|nr:excinuclease ABC subunit C [Bacteroidota bacterium]